MNNPSLLMLCYRNWKITFNYFFIHLIAIIDLLNSVSFKYSWLDKKCFFEMKLALFSIAGQCHHSGKCCEYIQIKYDRRWIKTVKDFERIKLKDKKMQRFYAEHKNGEIDHFSCSCLTDEKLCSKYDSRPNFCRVYPFGVLISQGHIHPGCGYYIMERALLPFYASKLLKQRIWTFKFNHSIG